MLAHAQGQRFDTLSDQKRIERAHACAEVAQGFGAQLHEVTEGAEGFVEFQAVISGRGFCDDVKTTVGPVEFAGFDNDAADRRAMPAHEFGG